MIIRAAIVGFLLWLLSHGLFRFFGQHFFYPDPTAVMLNFVASPFVMIALAWVLTKLLRVERGDEAEAAIGVALPGMLLDIYAVMEFSDLFPNLDPTLDGTFGALLLCSYAFLIFGGLLFTKIAARDERL